MHFPRSDRGLPGRCRISFSIASIHSALKNRALSDTAYRRPSHRRIVVESTVEEIQLKLFI